jgi:hypothetical protein
MTASDALERVALVPFPFFVVKISWARMACSSGPRYVEKRRVKPGEPG